MGLNIRKIKKLPPTPGQFFHRMENYWKCNTRAKVHQWITWRATATDSSLKHKHELQYKLQQCRLKSDPRQPWALHTPCKLIEQTLATEANSSPSVTFKCTGRQMLHYLILPSRAEVHSEKTKRTGLWVIISRLRTEKTVEYPTGSVTTETAIKCFHIYQNFQICFAHDGIQM